MSEATIFECPYNLFLKQRLEFVVICDDHLAANVMRIFEREMIKLKEAWQVRVEKALESKRTTPPEPKSYWVRLSQAQIIARLYMYDSAKIKKPDSDDPASDEWAEYHRKKALSISKGTLRKAIDLLIGKGFLIERSKPGEEFGAPIYTLHRVNVQKALKALPSNPFTIFHYLGGVENFEPGGDIQNLNLPPTNFEPGEMQNLEVPPTEIGSGDIQNLEVNIDSSIDLLEDIGIYNEEEGMGNVAHRELPTLAPDQDEPYRPVFPAPRGDANDTQPHGDKDRLTPSHPGYRVGDRPDGERNHHSEEASSAPARDAENQRHASGTQQQAPVAAELSTGFPPSGKVAHAVKQPPASKRGRTPAAPKVDQAEVEAYLAVFDELYREVTGDPDTGYGHTGVDRKAITDDLLKPKLVNPKFVTPEKLRAVYRHLFKKPKDEKTGFRWADNMSIKAVCRNYATEAMALTAQAQSRKATQKSKGPVLSMAHVGDHLDPSLYDQEVFVLPCRSQQTGVSHA